MNVFCVLSRVSGINQNVIQIDDHKAIKQVSEDDVHEPLEDSRSIGQAKRY